MSTGARAGKRKAGDELELEQLRVKVQRMENERKAEKKAHEAAIKAHEAKQKVYENQVSALKKDKTDFCWKDKAHQQHLSACLSAFPQELVNLIGSLVPVWEWSQESKSADIWLSPDNSGLQRVARHSGTYWSYRSALSQPLSPSFSTSAAASPCSPSSLLSCSSAASPSPSSSSPERSSVAAFQVRVDQRRHGLLIGVGHCLPPDDDGAVGGKGFGVCYHSDGYVFINGQSSCNDFSFNFNSHLAKYGDGDVIGVEVDFSAKTVAFFKNGVMQDRPFDVSDFSKSGIDFSNLLYAAVTLSASGDKVTLL